MTKTKNLLIEKSKIAKISFNIILLSIISFLTFSCDNNREVVTAKIAENTNNKAIINNPPTIYYLTEEDKLLCRTTSGNIFNPQSIIAGTYPTIPYSRWYATTPPGINNAPTFPFPESEDKLWYFQILKDKIANFYNINSNNIYIQQGTSLPQFNDTTKYYSASLYISVYPTYDFYPETYITSTTATNLLHSILSNIDMRNDDFVGCTLFIENTMCGYYMGLGGQLYFKK